MRRGGGCDVIVQSSVIGEEEQALQASLPGDGRREMVIMEWRMML